MTWDEHFIALAKHIASRSKDPSSKVGAVIVDKDNRVVSTGYNGAPKGTSDKHQTRDQRLMRTLHAELNAVLFARRDLTGCTVYVTHHPCCRCAAVLAQVGIARVVHAPVLPAFAERWKDHMSEAQVIMQDSGIMRDCIG